MIDDGPIRRILLLALLGFVALPAMGQERHSEVRIVVPDRQAATRAAAVAEMDHVHLERTDDGWALTGILGTRERGALRAAGFLYEVIEPDVVARIQARAATCPSSLPEGSPEGFGYGSLHCFPTLDEAEAVLDAMHARHPDLITARESIGQTWEGREIWVVRISAAEDPESVPEALYTALHHAREPASLTSVLYFMQHLLEGYGTDEEVTHLLENRALYFIPVLNPDGYAFVEAENLMWRKNRSPNSDGSVGVDLNRNYAYHWDCGWGATSCNPSSNVYAGPHPFSEPETQALRDWLATRAIGGAYNFHAFGGYWLHPWGNTISTSASQTPDHHQFTAIGTKITRENGYQFGPGGVVLYPVAGGSDDWMYGEQTEKARIFAFTPEMGGAADHFWPAPHRIVPIARDALHANLVLAHLVGSFVREITPRFVGTGPHVAGGEVGIDVSMRNLGLEAASSVRARVVSGNPDLGPAVGSWSEPFGVGPFAQASSPTLTLSLPDDLVPGHYEGLSVEVDADGLVLTADLGALVVGESRFALEAPFPNPSPGDVELHFSVERAGNVTLTVYDLLGRRVRVLLAEDRLPGPHAVTWDGRDAAGRPVPAGTYVVGLRVPGEHAARRVTILR